MTSRLGMGAPMAQRWVLSLLCAAGLFGLGRGAAAEVELSAVAGSSPRPVECGGVAPGRGRVGRVRSTAWQRARQHGHARACAALAGGYGVLAAHPEAALAEARRALEAAPGTAAPLVLRGLALERLGRRLEAWSAFEAALAVDAGSVRSAEALLAMARSGRQAGEPARALAAYRRLVTVVGALESEWARLSTYLEAASAAMGQGPGGVDEALGYLAEARRGLVAPGSSDLAAAALALALDRAGRSAEARQVPVDLQAVWSFAELVTELEEGRAPAWRRVPVLPLAELHAMAAMLAQWREPSVAVTHWEAYLRDPGAAAGPFAEHARRRLEEARGGRRR